MLDRLTTLGRELADGLLALLYPGVCAGCGGAIPPAEVPFCAGCHTVLTSDDQTVCPRCASSVGPFTDLSEGCPTCRGVVFHFERVLRLGPYDGLLRDLVLRLKHAHGEGLAGVLGELWAEHSAERLRQIGADVVVPVPLHWWRRLTRGYNQSEALAAELASKLRLPCRPRWLRRIRATPRQTLQSPTGRRENVKGVFHARPRSGLSGKTVLLVDDVLTTGGTASEAAKTLRAAGAARVVVAVLAHGPS